MSSSGLRKQHNRQLNICWKEQYICLPDEDICTVPSNGYFNCLLCRFIIPDEDICIIPCNGYFNCLFYCSLNPDEDICTVPSNRYSIVYYVVFSSQMKTYVLYGLRKQHNRQLNTRYLLEGTVHMSSSGLREQHNRQWNICWREQYICLHLD
jgi:hypothetical protein